MKRVGNVAIAERFVKNRSPILKVKITLSTKVIFERFERWDDGIKTDNSKIGKNPPPCCGEVPDRDGVFLCDCGRHLICVSDGKRGEGQVYFRRILKLPKDLFK